MANRVTNTDVQKIFPNDGVDLTSFIDTAHLIVDESLLNAGLSSARLTQIELYLAAHFALVTHERGGLQRQKAGDAEDYYQSSGFKTGLQATRYGQQATILDTSGTLGALATSAVKAQFRVVSKDAC
jgi:hypothetical protein